MTDVELTKLLCALLGTIPGWRWSETEPYGSGDVGIFYGPIGDFPERAVGVRVYDTDEEPLATGRRVQFRFRGAPNDPAGADALASAAEPVLRGISRHEGISGAARIVLARLGADSAHRDERADSYIITLDNEEAST